MSKPDDDKPAAPAPAPTGAAAPAAPVDPAAAAAALAAFEAELAGEAAAPAAPAAPAPSAPSAPAAPLPAKASAAPRVEAGAGVGMKELGPAKPLPVVMFDRVTKRYGDFTAIKDVSFKIDDHPGRGEFVSILGPSGCGKSTVIRLIAGLTPQFPHSSGRILVDGHPIEGPGPDRGMVFQDYTSFDNRSVLDNVAFGLECRGVGTSERLDRARHWIHKVGLSVRNDADKYPHELSGGMRQRVAIARTLILEPRIILMDEPFGALDPPTRARMQDNLVELWRDQSPTIFFITHSIEEAVYLGDHILIFSNSPGTVLKELRVPPPDRPSTVMQRDPKFLEVVFGIRDIIDKLESSKRAGD
ncbi:MAG: ABC transporter ATP-binding protein [Kofleriaceae bacterium]|nr:ABC transporter ATP-binding protein [Kofleriaceae bacterium]MBP9206105.1 ABC transporter ATP-binding protein [Kofleriaceae bacterium]